MRDTLLVRDLMSKPPITTTAKTLVKEALDRMRGTDIRHLAVIDGKGRLVGVLSERDAYRAFLESRDLSVTVELVMSKDVVTIRAETRGAEATALMLDHKIGCLPVVDEGGRPVGIITETDFLRLAHRFLGGDVLVDQSRASA